MNSLTWALKVALSPVQIRDATIKDPLSLNNQIDSWQIMNGFYTNPRHKSNTSPAPTRITAHFYYHLNPLQQEVDLGLLGQKQCRPPTQTSQTLLSNHGRTHRTYWMPYPFSKQKLLAGARLRLEISSERKGNFSEDSKVSRHLQNTTKTPSSKNLNKTSQRSIMTYSRERKTSRNLDLESTSQPWRCQYQISPYIHHKQEKKEQDILNPKGR